MDSLDRQTIQIEATIQQLQSGLKKTYVPFTDTEIKNNQHIGFGQRLEAVCEQQQLNVRADKMLIQFGWYWLEVEYLGKFHYFPNIFI